MPSYIIVNLTHNFTKRVKNACRTLGHSVALRMHVPEMTVSADGPHAPKRFWRPFPGERGNVTQDHQHPIEERAPNCDPLFKTAYFRGPPAV